MCGFEMLFADEKAWICIWTVAMMEIQFLIKSSKYAEILVKKLQIFSHQNAFGLLVGKIAILSQNLILTQQFPTFSNFSLILAEYFLS